VLLNGITLGERHKDANNQMIKINRGMSFKNIGHERVIWNLSIWINLMPLTHLSNYPLSHKEVPTVVKIRTVKCSIRPYFKFRLVRNVSSNAFHRYYSNLESSMFSSVIDTFHVRGKFFIYQDIFWEGPRTSNDTSSKISKIISWSKSFLITI